MVSEAAISGPVLATLVQTLMSSAGRDRSKLVRCSSGPRRSRSGLLGEESDSFAMTHKSSFLKEYSRMMTQ